MHARQPRFRRSFDASQYDLLLAALPVPLFAGWLYGTLSSAPPDLSVGVGGVFSVALLGYCLFVAAPVDRNGGRPDRDGTAERAPAVRSPSSRTSR